MVGDDGRRRSPRPSRSRAPGRWWALGILFGLAVVALAGGPVRVRAQRGGRSPAGSGAARVRVGDGWRGSPRRRAALTRRAAGRDLDRRRGRCSRPGERCAIGEPDRRRAADLRREHRVRGVAEPEAGRRQGERTKVREDKAAPRGALQLHARGRRRCWCSAVGWLLVLGGARPIVGLQELPRPRRSRSSVPARSVVVFLGGVQRRDDAEPAPVLPGAAGLGVRRPAGRAGRTGRPWPGRTRPEERTSLSDLRAAAAGHDVPARRSSRRRRRWGRSARRPGRTGPPTRSAGTGWAALTSATSSAGSLEELAPPRLQRRPHGAGRGRAERRRDRRLDRGAAHRVVRDACSSSPACGSGRGCRTRRT